MTLQPSSLAGTRFAYRPCGRCGHMWIRHAFSGRPRCTQTVTRGVLNSAGDVAPAPVQCDCPGWMEKGPDVTQDQPAAGPAAAQSGEGGQQAPAPARTATAREYAVNELHRAHADYMNAVEDAHLRFLREVERVHALLGKHGHAAPGDGRS